MNKNILMSVIVRNGDNVSGLADKIGLSRTALYNKINGKVDFTRSEIEKIKNAYDIDDAETISIFFAD